MKTYVIQYDYQYPDQKVTNDVIWKGENRGDAIDTFWASFDDRDAKKVSRVRLYELHEVACDTNNPKEYE